MSAQDVSIMPAVSLFCAGQGLARQAGAGRFRPLPGFPASDRRWVHFVSACAPPGSVVGERPARLQLWELGDDCEEGMAAPAPVEERRAHTGPDKPKRRVDRLKEREHLEEAHRLPGVRVCALHAAFADTLKDEA